MFGWDALASADKFEPDKKFVMCQTTERKMVKKVIADYENSFPSRAEGYPDTVCARDIIETVAEIADQI